MRLDAASAAVLCFFTLQLVEAKPKLRFLQVWFRHGERTPTNYIYFPTDTPNPNVTLPSDPGELTENGIRQEFILGSKLRKIYGEFLGEYHPGSVRIYAGEDNRTIASAQAVLASLYQPSMAQQFRKGFPWQPVPVHTRADLDEVSFGIVTRCEGLAKKYADDPRYKAILEDVDPQLLEFLRENTGMPITTPYEYQNILDSLKTKQNMNSSALPFPEWAEPIAPQLRNLSTTVHVQMTKLLNDSSGGFHADLFLSAIEEQLLYLPDRKALLISGHDTNLFVLGAFFHTHTLTDDLCKYAAHLSLEFYEDDEREHPDRPPTPEQITIKMIYKYSLDAEAEEIEFPTCPAPCTLARLQELAAGRRWSAARWRAFCDSGVDPMSREGAVGHAEEVGMGVLSGALLIGVAVLVLACIILLYLTCSYKKQLAELKDPEQRPLIG